MREKLDDDDDDDVYKELVYISKRWFCVLRFFVFLCRRLNFFFLSFSATKLIVEFKFRVLCFRVLFETLNFLYFVSLFKIQKRLTLSTRNNARAFPRDSFDEFEKSFEERRPKQKSLLLSLKLHSLKEKPPDFSLNRYTFLSQRVRRRLWRSACTRFLQKCA